MKQRAEITFLVLFAMAVGLSSCKENPPPQTKAEVKKVDAEPEPPVIGRLTFMEKNVFRYLRDAKDWALAIVDVPVGDGDVLYSDVQGRSEVTFPNDTTVRINDKTKIQLDGVTGNQTAMFVNSGAARIKNGSADTLVKVDTPYGQVLSKQPGAFDVYVGDSSVAVTAFNEGVRFVDGRGTQYDVKPGAESLLANQSAVVSSQRFLDSTWDSWNNERDNESKLWEENPSPYLPAQLRSDTKVLADNGNWEQLNYNGETAHYWTPRNVAPDWSPFTVGQWTAWNGEQLWVPYERFGWVTHHHGGWIHFNNHWYWRPPVAGRWRYVPWYPARVAWVNHGRYIGWVPITPYEAYYGRRYWGPRSVVYHQNMRYVEFHKYVNVNRVVIVDKDRLYGVHRRYETTRDVKIVKEVVNNGRAAPIVTRDVVKGADLKMEHHFARSGDFSRKPNADGVSEIAARRRGGSGGTQTAQGTGEGIQKASLRPSDTKGGQPSAAKAGDDNKRNLPATPRELKREERQERRLETKGDRAAKEGPGQQQHQQKQQLVKEQQQQHGQQDAQQRRQQQLEQRQQQQGQRQQQQQQQQLAHQQQQAQRQQQQAERQQQIQAQRQQQQAQQQQQAAQRQQQAQAQQQQGQQRQNQKHAHQQ